MSGHRQLVHGSLRIPTWAGHGTAHLTFVSVGDPADNVATYDVARLRKELQRAETEITRIDTKLGNADFLARAPGDVIDEQKERRADAEALALRLRDAVAHLG